MLKHTLEQIKDKIELSPNIPEEKKDEYFNLLNDLNTEINKLQVLHNEQANSIKGFTKISAHEATRDEINPNLIKIAMDGLSSSVKELEISYPKLVSIVNSMSSFLSKLGI